MHKFCNSFFMLSSFTGDREIARFFMHKIQRVLFFTSQ